MAAPPPYDLPPGVYFNPSPEECVRDYLRPWIASRCAGAEPRDGAVFPVDVYCHSPDELRHMFPPGHARGTERRWYFLTPRGSIGGRGKRRVATGGNWKVEQKTKDLADDNGGDCGGGKRRTYGFYLPDASKTAWLMEELMVADGCDRGGKGKRGAEAGSVPVFCRIYVSPRADAEDRRAILGEDGVAVGQDGKAKPVCVPVADEYFDMLAARLPPSCLRRARGHPPPLQGGVGHHCFYGHDDPPPAVHGHHQQYYVPTQAPHGFVDHQHHPYGLYDAPPIHVAVPPRHEDKEEDMHRAEKKPRLTYASPAPQLAAMNATTTPKRETQEASESSQPHQSRQQQEPPAQAAPTPPPQEEETPAPAPPVNNDDDVTPPATELDAAFQQDAPSKDPSPSSGSTDLSSLTHVSFGDDFGLACDASQLGFHDGDQFSFPLQDILQSDIIGSFDDFDVSWMDDGFGPLQ